MRSSVGYELSGGAGEWYPAAVPCRPDSLAMPPQALGQVAGRRHIRNLAAPVTAADAGTTP